MEVKIMSSRIIKPLYEGNHSPITNSISLSVFDKITYDTHIAIIYAYRPPTPPNGAIEVGLQKALAVYREWAGRLGIDDNGEPAILLNDEGVKFIEAYVDSTLDQELPFKSSPSLLSFHPSWKPKVCPWVLEDGHEEKDSSEGVIELVQVQLTRFKCGSLVVGFTAHHFVADGNSTSNFLVAWGQACRGVEISPLPFHDRTIFTPRNPPVFEFEHKGVEFICKNFSKAHNFNHNSIVDNIVLHKVHYTVEFLAKLKVKASSTKGNNNIKPFSTFESLLAHLWRAITKSRRLSELETTHVRISVDGRHRLNPKVPNEYVGNLVLWAFPTTKVKTLLEEPLSYAAKLIHDAIKKVNNNYFRSFIDFANYKVKEENLMTSADINKDVYCPNVEVDSWLRFPFYDLDFGGGCPYIFMPSYYQAEGVMLFLPSYTGDGSIEVYIPLFEDNLATFKQVCYNMD
ncbi:agmatine coumaroyltransferase-2-like [Olea europaea subsp. europaea]|uniref:Agmatine coumaroyltransferase-2-like n=1 Tax=Olea europaea subsp. europaea TaxID=158383 RepID=A0A8S0VNJ6_OLEEU|nr:agmatine coumaroyltransferase-2-like [Olea europaea subsp. europaea]